MKDFNPSEAQAYLDILIKRYKIKVVQYSKLSCGWANWHTKEIKIPKPTTLDRFLVGLHEVHHIIDGDSKPYRFQQEFDCDHYALKIAEELGYYTGDWILRIRWHILMCIARAMNRGLTTTKIPQYIKDYFNDVDFNQWQGKKVFVSSYNNYSKIEIKIKERVKKTSLIESVSCDVWHGEEGLVAGECLTIDGGILLMKKLKEDGRDQIRMYADYESGSRMYYKFNSEGEVVCESNNL